MNERKPTEVCITVDTEFSIGGNFDDPLLTPVAEPIVLGAVGGKEHGLGFLLDSLCEFDVRATFFVEALQTAYFGAEPMGGVARRIAGAGHDVQLHLHPCWMHYSAAPDGSPKGIPSDSCAGRTDADLDQLFRSGLAAFSRWKVPRPVAVRTGNFQVDINFYQAAARAGVLLSSSVAVAVERPLDHRLWLAGGCHRFGSVTELPVVSYSYAVGRNARLRLLSITACSVAEIVSVLRQARQRAISPVIILTHPQEFIKHTDFRYTKLRPNRVNQDRFRGLLKFLKRNKQDFVVRPIVDIKETDPRNTQYRDPSITVSSFKAIARMVENGINDRIWWY
ncbi:MAG: hypothetical protein ACREE2_11705 [Stellaceae bacterium]